MLGGVSHWSDVFIIRKEAVMEKNIANSSNFWNSRMDYSWFSQCWCRDETEDSEESKKDDSLLDNENIVFDCSGNFDISLSEDGIKHGDFGKMDADMNFESISCAGWEYKWKEFQV